MKSGDALRVLAGLTASQWGMVTSAQAVALGVTRLDLSRLTRAGYLERLAHGIYKDSGAPGGELEDLRAAWLSTEPAITAEQRLDDAGGVVVAGVSAARLHGIGDLWADRHEFVSPVRRQSQRPEIHFRRRVLDPRDVTLVGGLPVMTLEATVADLVDQVGDLSLVADALRDAARRRGLDLDRMSELLASRAERCGLRIHDGRALLDRLVELAGIDADTVSQQVAADPSLAPRVMAQYLHHLITSDAAQDRESLRGFQHAMQGWIEDVLSPQAEAARVLRETIVGSGSTDTFRALAKAVTDRLTEDGSLQRLVGRVQASLSDHSSVRPDTVAAVRAIQSAVTDDHA